MSNLGAREWSSLPLRIFWALNCVTWARVSPWPQGPLPLGFLELLLCPSPYVSFYFSGSKKLSQKRGTSPAGAAAQPRCSLCALLAPREVRRCSRAPQLRLLFAGPRDALQLLEGALGSASRTELQPRRGCRPLRPPVRRESRGAAGRGAPGPHAERRSLLRAKELAPASAARADLGAGGELLLGPCWRAEATVSVA